MTETTGDIRVDLDEEGRIILVLGGFPLGLTSISISSDQWNALVGEVVRKRGILLAHITQLQREGKAAAAAASTVERSSDHGARYEASNDRT